MSPKVYDPHVLTDKGMIEGQEVELDACPHRPVPGICVAGVWEMDRHSLSTAITNGITIYPGWYTPKEA